MIAQLLKGRFALGLFGNFHDYENPIIGSNVGDLLPLWLKPRTSIYQQLRLVILQSWELRLVILQSWEVGIQHEIGQGGEVQVLFYQAVSKVLFVVDVLVSLS
jgi:hypothetical protein